MQIKFNLAKHSVVLELPCFLWASQFTGKLNILGTSLSRYRKYEKLMNYIFFALPVHIFSDYEDISRNVEKSLALDPNCDDHDISSSFTGNKMI